MNTKTYRISQSRFGILLFPTPVQKEAMFLITAPTEFHAEVYKYLLDFGALAAPLDPGRSFRRAGTHTDRVTPIFEVNWDELELRILPLRHLDVSRATLLEQLFAKKFTQLLRAPERAGELIRDIQFRFSQQQLCSECQRLGISDVELVKWFEGLSRWGRSGQDTG